MSIHRSAAAFLVVIVATSQTRADPVRRGPPPIVYEVEPGWLELDFWIAADFGAMAPVEKEESDCPTAIASRINGDFDGWHGDTLFHLTNGQLWRQASRHLSHAYKHSPEALVYWADGTCKLKVSGMMDEIVVDRIE